MVLTTHAIVGAGIASLIPGHPVKAFVLGFISHFILDSIPHWDYKLRSSKPNKVNPLQGDIEVSFALLGDLVKIAADCLLGFVIAFFLFTPYSWAEALPFFAGMAGAIFPDPLQFLYYRYRKQPLVWLQRFHVWIHAKHKLTGYPVPGATLQAMIVVVVMFIIGLVK